MPDFNLDLAAFDGIENAKETFQRNYLNPGVYELEILSVKFDESRKKVKFFAVDFKVLGSNNDKHKIGDQVNFYTGADKDGFLSNVKNFSKSALYEGEPIDDASITKEIISEIIKDSGEAVRGKRVMCSVTQVPTKPTTAQPQGGLFSRHVFSPVTAQAA